jgi:hypothetical protein
MKKLAMTIGFVGVAACAQLAAGCAGAPDGSSTSGDRVAVTSVAGAVTVGADDASVTFTHGAQDYAKDGEWLGRVELVRDGSLRIMTPAFTRTTRVASSFSLDRLDDVLDLSPSERESLARMTNVITSLSAHGVQILDALATRTRAPGVHTQAIMERCSWRAAMDQCTYSGYASASCQNGIDQLISWGC